MRYISTNALVANSGIVQATHTLRVAALNTATTNLVAYFKTNNLLLQKGILK